MQKNKKIAVFGGTFNPVHNGHINLLQDFSKEINFDKILILPSCIPPHKSAPELVSGEKRAEMLKIAFSDFPKAEICDYEIKRGGVNYTSDTLGYLKSVYPTATLYFIMGTDMLFSFNTWHEPKKILENAVLLCGSREDKTAHKLRNFALGELGLKEENFIVSEARAFEVSSSEIREKVKLGEDISALVPNGVAEYIKQEGLYEK